MIQTEIMEFSCFMARVGTRSFHYYLPEFLNIQHVGSDIQKYRAFSPSTEIKSYKFWFGSFSDSALR